MKCSILTLLWVFPTVFFQIIQCNTNVIFPDKLKQCPLLLVTFVCAEVTFVYFASQCHMRELTDSELPEFSILLNTVRNLS